MSQTKTSTKDTARLPRQLHDKFYSVLTISLAAALLALLPADAMAQQFDIPFITQFGCSVVKWMKGPLAILIFVVVVIATLVIGMISKMDWSRIIAVCVVFGIIIGLGGILANSSYFQAMPAMQSCLA
jgi:type IV secretory pathway VirB2 component (pilin)